MKIGRVFPDLLTRLGAAPSIDDGLARTLRRLIGLTGASAGLLVFRPPRRAPLVVSAARGRMPAALDAWLRARAEETPPRSPRLVRVRQPGVPGTLAALRAPLGPPAAPVGSLTLVGRVRRSSLPAGFPRELGVAIERVWQAHRRTVRLRGLSDITRLAASSEPLEAVVRAFGEALAGLVPCDAIGAALVDTERGEASVVDVSVAAAPRGGRAGRVPLEGTLLARLAADPRPLRIDDTADAGLPPRTREFFAARGLRSAIVAPLVARGAVAGAVTAAAREPSAFTDADLEVFTELAQPLASAIAQRRLLEESNRRAEALAALYRTSRLISARLELPAVLEEISRAVTALTGGTGCGIGLLDAAGRRLEHVAAHGFESDEWRRLSLPVGEGIIGTCARDGVAIRVDDVRVDPRSARRDIDELEGLRSLLCVPLRAAGALIGVISAISTEPGAFTAHHQGILEAFAEQAGIAIHNARLFEERARRARETRALLEAGRAVTASLDVQQTIRVIMEEARSVLGVESCGLFTVEPESGDLVGVASLDLPPEMATRIRVKPGEGIGGRAFSEQRPVQSEDLSADPRVLYPELQKVSGLRSTLAAPLRAGSGAIGVIYVFRRDVHRYTEEEEALLMALADQAAIALEHARLYARLEDVVAERTRELDRQKRFVEVVLETLPLGVFVLDDALHVVRANAHGGRVLGCAVTDGCRITDLVPPERQAAVRAFLEEAFRGRRVSIGEEEMSVAGEPKTFRLTAAPFESDVTHLVLLVEDVTLAKRLERQMLLTERLTTAGRLAAGVAHELNNPLATIAGCAESLLARTREAPLAGVPEIDEFRHYLGLIEEEAYRCKDITGSLLQFVREPDSRRTPTDLNALVLKTVDLLAHQTRFGGRRFVTELDESLPAVAVNEGQLRQVFLGIASNALEAMGPGGPLTIRTRRRRHEVEIEFEDEGPGIPEDLLGRIFEPFFTTKPAGQGTGLGLAIAQGIVTDHGGRIEVTSRVGKGSIFRVVLPS